MANTLKGGGGDDFFAGGGGHDYLYAGTGSDTFAFSSTAAADYDRILGFDPANDTVQFDSTVFTKLTAGPTPTSSIGTASNSSTDYLFYNSSNGGLYYDPDGNGTPFKPEIIAKSG